MLARVQTLPRPHITMAFTERQELTTFGASIVKPEPALRAQPSSDSGISAQMADAAKKEWAADPSNPYSAFYKHPEARRSMDAGDVHSKTHLDIHTTERDVEAGKPLSPATTQQQTPKVSVDGRLKECTMWPSRQAIMDQRKTAKRHRGCAAFHNLTRKQRLWVKIVIALLIVAAAVGLGVGISKAVGGGVWAGVGQNRPISDH